MKTDLSKNATDVFELLTQTRRFTMEQAADLVAENLPYIASPENMFSDIWKELKDSSLIEWVPSPEEESLGKLFRIVPPA